MADPLFPNPFDVIAEGAAPIPFIFSSPHSGRDYPEPFLMSSRLDERTLRRSEDCYVDLIFGRMPELGAPLMLARFPRAYLDANREPYELDPRMFDGRLPGYANTRSMRVAGGLGTIPRIVGEGQEIYSRRLSVDAALNRIAALHRPYHRQLRQLIQAAQVRFGQAVLVDCHSMPSASLHLNGGVHADIVLGDRFGTSAAPRVVDAFQMALESQGFSVLRNRPYAGGYITEHYGNPRSGVHAVQIEINRALYVDEQTLVPLDALDSIVDRVTSAMAHAIEMILWDERDYALAAE